MVLESDFVSLSSSTSLRKNSSGVALSMPSAGLVSADVVVGTSTRLVVSRKTYSIGLVFSILSMSPNSVVLEITVVAARVLSTGVPLTVLTSSLLALVTSSLMIPDPAAAVVSFSSGDVLVTEVVGTGVFFSGADVLSSTVFTPFASAVVPSNFIKIPDSAALVVSVTGDDLLTVVVRTGVVSALRISILLTAADWVAALVVPRMVVSSPGVVPTEVPTVAVLLPTSFPGVTVVSGVFLVGTDVLALSGTVVPSNL